MNVSKKNAFYISLSALIIYTLYVVLIKANRPQILAPDFYTMMWNFAKSKLIYFVGIYALLRLESDSLLNIGFHKKELGKQIGWGLLLGAACWIFEHIIFDPILKSVLPETVPKGTDMSIYMHNLSDLAVWVPLIILASFVEELERVFMITRLQNWFGKAGLYIGLVFSSLIFGIGHLYQGYVAAIGTGLGGLLFALVYLRKRSATEAFLAHAFFDLISIIVGYIITQ